MGNRSTTSGCSASRRQHGLSCRVRRRPPQAGSVAALCPNLLRGEQIVPTAPDQVWQADFTYMRVRSGWLYLACVLDGYSRKVIDWALSKRADATLTCAALQMALDMRHVTPQLIHHSDQGVQYQSQAYQALPDTHHIRFSLRESPTCECPWGQAGQVLAPAKGR